MAGKASEAVVRIVLAGKVLRGQAEPPWQSREHDKKVVSSLSTEVWVGM